MQPAAPRDDSETASEGMDFPASLPTIIRPAADRGGIDREVLELVRGLLARQYEILGDLFEAVWQGPTLTAPGHAAKSRWGPAGRSGTPA